MQLLATVMAVSTSEETKYNRVMRKGAGSQRAVVRRSKPAPSCSSPVTSDAFSVKKIPSLRLVLFQGNLANIMQICKCQKAQRKNQESLMFIFNLSVFKYPAFSRCSRLNVALFCYTFRQAAVIQKHTEQTSQDGYFM